MKKYIYITILALSIAGIAQASMWTDFLNRFQQEEIQLGAPTSIYQRTILPEANRTYDLGSPTALWESGFFLGVTTTNATISGISGSTQCLQVDTNGVVSGYGSGCGTIANPDWVFSLDATYITPSTSPMGIFITASSTIEADFRVQGNATTTGSLDIGDNLYMKDDKYLYFDTAEHQTIRYSTAHGGFVWGSDAGTTDLSTALDLKIYANTATDASGNWEPYLAFQTNGNALIKNTLQGTAGNRYLEIDFTDGMRINQGGIRAGHLNATTTIMDNATTTKTFEIGEELVVNGERFTSLIAATTTLDYWFTNTAGIDTDGLSEGSTNLWYTDVRVADYINASTTMPVGDWNTAFGWGDHSVAGYYAAADFNTDWDTRFIATTTWSGNLTIDGDLSVSGNMNILDADVPDTITASNYLLLTGGTLTGGLTMTSATTSQSTYFTEYTTCNLDTDANGLLVCGTDADTTYLGGTNLTLVGTTFNVDDAFLVNSAADTTAFGLTMGSATSSDSFYIGTKRVYGEQDRVIVLATSTLDYISGATSTIPIDYNSKAKTISEIYCITDSGAATLKIGDGTNFTGFLECSSSGSTDSSPSNNTYTAREKMEIQVGNKSTLGNWLNVIITESYD